MKSPQTGAEISLPGREVAQIRIDSLFGEGDLNEGSMGTVISGSIRAYNLDQLIIRYAGNQK
ncbi:MAG: hypothetical protein ABIR84_01675 [Candidatus Nitrotoga sp.]